MNSSGFCNILLFVDLLVCMFVDEQVKRAKHKDQLSKADIYNHTLSCEIWNHLSENAHPRVVKLLRKRGYDVWNNYSCHVQRS